MRVAHCTSGIAALAALACTTAFAAAAPKGGAAPAAFPGNDSSFSPAVSADGRYVAFLSLASNLVPNDTNGVHDVFVLDRNTDAVTRVSTNEYGGQADGQSWSVAISADGRFVAFASNASNLVEGDRNRAGDVFRKDLQTGIVLRATVDGNGQEATSGGQPRSDAYNVTISGDGRFVAYQSCLAGLDASFGCGGFLRDVVAGTTRRFESESETRPAVGARTVAGAIEVSIAFTTRSRLVPQDTRTCTDFSCQDVYLARTTVPPAGAPTAFAYTLVSRTSGGDGGNDTSGVSCGRGPSISADGTRIAFVTEASDLTSGNNTGQNDVYLYDTTTSALTREADDVAPQAGTLSFPAVQAALSPDGQHVVFFRTTTGNEGNWIVKAVPAGALEETIGEGAPVPGTRIEECGHGALSNGGTVGVFQTAQFDLPGTRFDTRSDVFVSTGVAARSVSYASRGRLGTERDGHTRVGAISGDGLKVAFASYAWNFEGTDIGAGRDIFVKSLADGSITRASTLFLPTLQVDAFYPDANGDGSRIVFGATGIPAPGTCPDGAGRAFVMTLQPASSMRCLDNDASGYTQVLAEPFPQPVISDDGRWAAFGAFDSSSNVNGTRRLFVRDLQNDTLVRLDAFAGGVRFENGTIQLSRDGRYLVHSLDGPGLGSVGYTDLATPQAPPVVASRFAASGNAAPGRWGSISADGNWIAFVSEANLTAETPAPRGEQVFLFERATGALTRVAGDNVGRNDGTFKARTRLSADGRYLAYVVDDVCTFRCASRLREVVFYDRVTRIQSAVSLTPSWGRPNGPSAQPEEENGEAVPYTMDMSADGSKIVFASSATDLASDDENAADDIYVVDRAAQTVTLVSRAGAQAAGDDDRVAPSMSGDGALLAYAVKDRDGAAGAGGLANRKRGSGIGNKWSDVAIQSPLLGEVVVSTALGGGAANGDSGRPSITANGGFIAYQSDATNLTADLDSNDATDIVIHDADKGMNVTVSKTIGGQAANGASTDPAVGFAGNKWGVAFTSSATNLGAGGDTNGVPDVMFAREGDNGAPPTTVLVSVSTAGTPSNGPSGQADVDPDASFVTFSSLGNNLAPGDTNNTTDVFMRNLLTNETVLLSAAPGNAPANGPSTNAVGDKFGSGPTAPPIVAFETDASNLGGVDLNGASDIYAWTPSGGMFVVSRGLGGATANGGSSNPQISRGGRYISFVSSADNIVVGDDNGLPDVFVYDTTTTNIRRISVGHAGQDADDVTTSAAVAIDGAGDPVVAWDSAANNLTGTPDPDEAFDLFLTVGALPPEPILLEGDLVFRSGFE